MMLPRRRFSAVLIVTFLFVSAGHFPGTVRAQESAKRSDSILQLPVGGLVSGEAQIVDLTYSLGEQSPFWPGDNYQPFQLRPIATLEKNGVSSKAFSMPEHFGTHIDAPCHFEKGQPTVDEIAVSDLFAMGVVIDVSLQSEANADYRVTVDDLMNWEALHGRIPGRCVVFLKTGWSRFWNSNERFRNQDANGKMHFPGFSEQSARWLVKERDVRGIGIDTLSIDYGLSKDFVVHHVINGAGRYGLENVANLDSLPPRDFIVIVAPIKIASGTGGPTRLFAALPARRSSHK